MNDPAAPTPFVEANTLLAVQSGDYHQARTLIADMLPSELRLLAQAAEELASMCRSRLTSGPS